MIKGETYYKKFQTTPTTDLALYAGTFKVSLNGFDITGLNGPLIKFGTYYELSFQTTNMDFGNYKLECFNHFPDGFIECFHEEIITIEY